MKIDKSLIIPILMGGGTETEYKSLVNPLSSTTDPDWIKDAYEYGNNAIMYEIVTNWKCYAKIDMNKIIENNS